MIGTEPLPCAAAAHAAGSRRQLTCPDACRSRHDAPQGAPTCRALAKHIRTPSTLARARLGLSPAAMRSLLLLALAVSACSALVEHRRPVRPPIVTPLPE